MNYRILGKTGFKISEVSFGAWAIGGTWGTVDDDVSLTALESAIDNGVNFFDTADVYGDGRSERLVSKLAKSQKQKIYIATKAGRRLDPHNHEGYNIKNITAFVERSLKNLDVETIDLLQMHCPPTSVYDNEEFFDDLNTLVKDGKVQNLGVSVEKVAEAERALAYDNVATVQIIFNMFRHKPAESFFAKAKAANVGILARVPLASGMLTGKMTANTAFEDDDHRKFNRNGEAFDKGETFSGVDYSVALQAVELLKAAKPADMSMVQFALKWILMHDAISCVIPGGKNPQQVTQNTSASSLPALGDATMKAVKDIYDSLIKKDVHELW